MPKQKRKRGHGWTVQKKSAAPPDPVLEWWDIVAIEGEHEDGRFLVRWDGIDPKTGQPWKLSYVAREHVKGPLVRQWLKKQGHITRTRSLTRQRLTDPPSTSDNTPETNDERTSTTICTAIPSQYVLNSDTPVSTSDVSGGLDENDLEALQNLRYPTPLDYLDDEDDEASMFAIKMEED